MRREELLVNLFEITMVIMIITVIITLLTATLKDIGTYLKMGEQITLIAVGVLIGLMYRGQQDGKRRRDRTKERSSKCTDNRT